MIVQMIVRDLESPVLLRLALNRRSQTDILLSPTRH